MFAQRSYLELWSALSHLVCFFWPNESTAIRARPRWEKSLATNWHVLWTPNVIWLQSNDSEHSSPRAVSSCDCIHSRQRRVMGAMWQIFKLITRFLNRFWPLTLFLNPENSHEPSTVREPLNSTTINLLQLCPHNMWTLWGSQLYGWETPGVYTEPEPHLQFDSCEGGTHSKEVLVSHLPASWGVFGCGWDLSVPSLNVLPMSAWVLSWYCTQASLQQSKNIA